MFIVMLADVISTGDGGKSVMSATVLAGKSEIHSSSESGEDFVRVKMRGGTSL